MTMHSQIPQAKDPVNAAQLNRVLDSVRRLLGAVATNDYHLIEHGLDPTGGYHDHGPLTEPYGGTGQTDFVPGDILYSDASGSLARKAIGAIGTCLGVNASGLLAYISIPVNWGDIGGTLSNQIDLKAALDAKVNLQATASGITQSGNIHVSGTVTAGYLVGDGAGITNLTTDLDSCGGLVENASGIGIRLSNSTLTLNASGLSLGTVDGNLFTIKLHRFDVSGYVPVPADFSGAGELIAETITGRCYILSSCGSVLDIGTSGSSGILGLTGDVTATGPGSVPATIAAGAVTEAKMTLVDNTTWNANYSGHGFVPKLTGLANAYFNSCGSYTVPDFIDISGTLALSQGGTGQTTASGAFNALSPTTTKGDLIVDMSGTDGRLAVGADGKVLMADSSASGGIKWQSLSFSNIGGALNFTDISGTLGVSKGGTGQTTASGAFNALSPLTTKGDIISYTGSTGSRLAVGSSGQVLFVDSTTATGLKWDTLSFSAVSGTLSVSAGGTGQTSASGAFNALCPLTAQGDLVVFNGATNARLPMGSNGQILSTNPSTTPGLEWIDNSGGGGITALTGDVTGSGTGSIVTTIAAGAVTTTMMGNRERKNFEGVREVLFDTVLELDKTYRVTYHILISAVLVEAATFNLLCRFNNDDLPHYATTVVGWTWPASPGETQNTNYTGIMLDMWSLAIAKTSTVGSYIFSTHSTWPDYTTVCGQTGTGVADHPITPAVILFSGRRGATEEGVSLSTPVSHSIFLCTSVTPPSTASMSGWAVLEEI